MNRPGSSMSRAKTNKGTTNFVGMSTQQKKEEKKLPTLEECLKKRDWICALVLLEFERGKAISIYDELLRKPSYDKNLHLFKACCLYAEQNYDSAKREALKGPEGDLQNRLMFHISHKKSDEKNLMAYHHKLQTTTSDQLCLAAIHYLRGHYEEATDIYKKLLLENREYQAINYYVALCYYKMDFYDVSLEILQTYLNANGSSTIANNLKACNQFQLYNGKAAEDVFKPLIDQYNGDLYQDNDLLRHNLVVFRNGENALKVLPQLVDAFPEARLNLVIYYLRNEEPQEAYKLIKDLEPSVPREYIIKGVVHAIIGQQTGNREYLKTAQQLFQLVGSSASECDTIPGRQCMASCFFLLKQFDDVLVYLQSIRSFFATDDDFLWNFGITLAATGNFKESEEQFSAIQNERSKNDDCLAKWMTKVYIMNGKPKMAWDLYINMETSNESFNLLQLIANDCYKMGHFYYAAKAFDILDRLDSDRDYEDALRGSVVEKESTENLVEVMTMLKSSGGNTPQVEYIFRVVQKWGNENGVEL